MAFFNGLLNDVDVLRRFAKALGWLLVLSAVGFVLLPSAPAYDTPSVTGRFQPVFEVADRLNLEFNMLPSLHVAMAVLCAVAYSQGSRRTVQVFVVTWAVAVSLSTLVTHQHHLADVIIGAACAALVAVRKLQQMLR